MREKSFFKSGMFYMAGNLFSRGTGFILLPLYSQYIPASEYGKYALLLSFYAVIAVIIQCGLQNGFTKLYFDTDDQKERKRLFSTYLNSSVIQALGICSVIIMLSTHISSFILGSPEYSGLIRITAIMNFVDAVLFSCFYLLKTMEYSKMVFNYSVVSAFFNLLLNVFLVAALSFGIEGILYAQIISNLIIVALLLFTIRQYIIPVIDRKYLVSILMFSAPLVLAGIMTNMTDVADRFILNSFFDTRVVGIYSFSYKIAMLMNVLVISFRTAWTPYSLRVYKENALSGAVFSSQLRKLIAMFAVLFLCVSLLTDDMFTISIYGKRIFDAQYLPGISIIPAVLCGYVFSGLSSFYSVYPFAINKSSYFLYADAISFIANIILNLLLIPYYGMKGAALATCFSYFFSMIYMAVISRPLKINYNVFRLSIYTGLVASAYFTSTIFSSLVLDILIIALMIPVSMWFAEIKKSDLSLFK